MGMLKKNYSAMEQKITVLEMEVQSLQKIKTSKSTGGKSGELNKSSNSNKTFGRRPDLGHSKNVFSVSMQVKKMKENSLYPVKLPDITSQSQEVHLSGKEGETDRLSLNESGMWVGRQTQITQLPESKYFHSTVDHHKGNINKLQVVAQVHRPDIHSEGTILTIKEDRNIKNTISNKKPPCTAKLLEQGDTYEKFLERNSEIQCKTNWLHSKNFFSKADSEDEERPLSTVTSLYHLPHNTLTGPASIHQRQPSEELNCCNVEENIKSGQLDNFLVLRERSESRQKTYKSMTFINSKLKKYQTLRSCNSHFYQTSH
ncbi:hypothetical protein J6590_067675, partial [Homalodisca vitripennis]